MKRLLIGGAAALVVAGAAGWGLWRWGAGEIEARIDARVAELAADGLSMTWRDRRVSGFPTGYVVRFDDVVLRATEDGDTIEAPWVEARAGLAAEGDAVVTAASPVIATVATTPDSAPRRLAVASADLSLTTPLSGEGPTRLNARAMTVTSEGGGGMVALEGIALAVTAAGDGATAQGTVAALRSESGAGAARAVTEARDIKVSARALGAGEGLGALIAEDGLVEATIEIGASQSDAAGLRSEGGPARTSLTISAGRIGLQAASEAGRYDIALPGRNAVGRIDVARTSLAVSAPLRRAEEAQPFSAAVTVEAAAPDEAAWRALDPADALPREPFALRLDLSGAARLTADLAAAAESLTPPVALETLEIRTAEARGGGLSAQVSGAMALGGAAGAQGRFDVAMSGWAPMLAALAELGVVGPDQAALLALTLERYNAPDAPDGAFEAQVVLDGPTAFVNGAPLQ